MCHRAEGMAPMSLTTFSEVRPWVRSIKMKVQDRVDAAVVRRQDGRHPAVRERSLADRPRDRSDREAGSTPARRRAIPAICRRRKSGRPRTSGSSPTYFGPSARPRREVARLHDAGRVAGPVVGGPRQHRHSGGPLGRRDRDSPGQALTQSRASRDDDALPEGDGGTARLPPFGAERQGRRRRCSTRATRPEDPSKLQEPTPAGQAFSEWAVGKNGELYVEHEAGQFLRAGSEIGWDIHLNASGEETPVEVETAFWFYPKGRCRSSAR